MMVEPPNRLPWPPILYAAAIAAGVILNTLWPLPWVGAPARDILFAVGAVMILGTIAIDLTAMRELRRARTTIMPHKAAEHLVTRGPFGFSRNPIYLANTMLVIGIGLVTGIAWFIPLGLIAAFATQKLAIEREERHLSKKFGKRFIDYARMVRRWI